MRIVPRTFALVINLFIYSQMLDIIVINLMELVFKEPKGKPTAAKKSVPAAAPKGKVESSSSESDDSSDEEDVSS